MKEKEGEREGGREEATNNLKHVMTFVTSHDITYPISGICTKSRMSFLTHLGGEEEEEEGLLMRVWGMIDSQGIHQQRGEEGY